MTWQSGRQFPPFLWAKVNMKIQLLPPQTNTHRANTYTTTCTLPPPSPPPHTLSLPFSRDVKLSCSSRLSHTGTSPYTTTSLSPLHLYPYICFHRLQNASSSFSVTIIVIKLLPICCSDVCQAQRAGKHAGLLEKALEAYWFSPCSELHWFLVPTVWVMWKNKQSLDQMDCLCLASCANRWPQQLISRITFCCCPT